MKGEQRTVQLLTDWLEDQPSRAPDRLLQSVFNDLQRTPQRGRWRAALRRFPLFHPTVTRYAMALGAVALAAAVGLGVWRGGVLDLIGSQCRLPQAPQEALATEIATDGPPGYVTFADCSFWVATTSAGTVQRIDVSSNEILATIDVGEPSTAPGGTAMAIAADGDQVWVAVQNPIADLRLVRIDPATNSVAQEFPVQHQAYSMLILDGRAWLSDFETNRLGVYDLETGELVQSINLGNGPVQIGAGFGAVWGRDGTRVVRIDSTTFEVTRHTVPGRAIYVTVGATGVWSASPEGGIFKLSPETGEVVVHIESEPEPVRSAGLDGYVYVGSQFASPDRLELLRIDEQTGETVERIPAPKPPGAEVISSAGGSLWLSGEQLVRIQVPDRP